MRRSVILGLLLTIGTACAPAVQSSDSSAVERTEVVNAFDSAAAVFRARVIWYEVGIDSQLAERGYGMRVGQVWKGSAPDSSRIEVRETVGECPLRRLTLFEEYILYARRDSTGVYLDRCSRVIPLAGDSARREIAYLTRAYRQGND